MQLAMVSKSQEGRISSNLYIILSIFDTTCLETGMIMIRSTGLLHKYLITFYIKDEVYLGGWQCVCLWLLCRYLNHCMLPQRNH